MDGEDLMDLLVSQLGTFGNDETPAEGVADSLLCIKKGNASYKRYEK